MAFPPTPLAVGDRPIAVGTGYPVRDANGAVVGLLVSRDLAEAFVVWANRNLPDRPAVKQNVLDRAYALAGFDDGAPRAEHVGHVATGSFLGTCPACHQPQNTPSCTQREHYGV